MTDALRPPSLQVSVPNDAPALSGGGGGGGGNGPSTSSTPTLRRKRFKMRRMRNVPSEKESGRLIVGQLSARSRSASKEYLQLPSIEITPSSDEDAPSSWSRCSTPSASPRRKRFLLRKWLKVREKKEQSSESRLVRPPHPPHRHAAPRLLLRPHIPPPFLPSFLFSSALIFSAFPGCRLCFRLFCGSAQESCV